MVEFAKHRPLIEEIERAYQLMDYVGESFGNTQSTRSVRNILSGTLYHLAYEHAASMVTLIEAGCPSSSLALLRPAYEALIRGQWTAHCATDRDADLISKNKMAFPGNRDISTQCAARSPQLLHGVCNAIHRAVPADFRHGLTHGGAEQFLNRFDGTTIRPNFPDDVLIGFVRAATTLMLGAMLGIAHQPGNRIDVIDLVGTFLHSFSENDVEVSQMLSSIKPQSPNQKQ